MEEGEGEEEEKEEEKSEGGEDGEKCLEWVVQQRRDSRGRGRRLQEWRGRARGRDDAVPGDGVQRPRRRSCSGCFRAWRGTWRGPWRGTLTAPVVARSCSLCRSPAVAAVAIHELRPRRSFRRTGQQYLQRRIGGISGMGWGMNGMGIGQRDVENKGWWVVVCGGVGTVSALCANQAACSQTTSSACSRRPDTIYASYSGRVGRCPHRGCQRLSIPQDVIRLLL